MQDHDFRLIKAAKRTIRAEATMVVVIVVITSWSVYALYKLSTGSGADALFGLAAAAAAGTGATKPLNRTGQPSRPEPAGPNGALMREVLARQRDLAANLDALRDRLATSNRQQLAQLQLKLAELAKPAATNSTSAQLLARPTHAPMLARQAAPGPPQPSLATVPDYELELGPSAAADRQPAASSQELDEAPLEQPEVDDDSSPPPPPPPPPPPDETAFDQDDQEDQPAEVESQSSSADQPAGEPAEVAPGEPSEPSSLDDQLADDQHDELGERWPARDDTADRWPQSSSLQSIRHLADRPRTKTAQATPSAPPNTVQFDDSPNIIGRNSPVVSPPSDIHRHRHRPFPVDLQTDNAGPTTVMAGSTGASANTSGHVHPNGTKSSGKLERIHKQPSRPAGPARLSRHANDLVQFDQLVSAASTDSATLVNGPFKDDFDDLTQAVPSPRRKSRQRIHRRTMRLVQQPSLQRRESDSNDGVDTLQYLARAANDSGLHQLLTQKRLLDRLQKSLAAGAASQPGATIDDSTVLLPAAAGELHEHSQASEHQQKTKKKKKESMSAGMEKGGSKKKKHKKDEKKFVKEKKFKGAKKGKKVSKGKGDQGGKKGKKLYKDKGFKKKGFKNVYHKEEFGQKKSYFDEFRDKDFKKKWKKFDDKYNYAQMKKWQAKNIKGAKKVKHHADKFKKYEKGKWKKKYHKHMHEDGAKAEKAKSSDDF